MSFDLRHADSRDELQKLEGASCDALVTDPPAGIEFMGKAWDSFRGDARQPGPGFPVSDSGPHRRAKVRHGTSNGYGNTGAREGFINAMCSVFEECLRVLKPGAHGLVWALPRTSHWTATALEDAGFEIRDRVSHLFGTGFPKSLNLDGGLGTALKPACEDWWLVRKPVDGTVAANVERYGTGALNIDGCRIGVAADEPNRRTTPSEGAKRSMFGVGGHEGTLTQGRWPANVTLDEEAAALLDEQSGELTSGATNGIRNADKLRGTYNAYKGQNEPPREASCGGASRFFYVAKPDRAERDIGCEDLPTASGATATDRKDGSAGLASPRAGAGRSGGARNIHPTVKSIYLMRWLCRLVTPRGGLVLDPFMGSGSTGVACSREGFRFIGIERERAYFEIARRRLHGDAPLFNRVGQGLGFTSGVAPQAPEKESA